MSLSSTNDYNNELGIPQVDRNDLRSWSRRGLRSVSSYATAGDVSNAQYASETWDQIEVNAARGMRPLSKLSLYSPAHLEYPASISLTDFPSAIANAPAQPQRGVASSCLLFQLDREAK